MPYACHCQRCLNKNTLIFNFPLISAIAERIVDNFEDAIHVPNCSTAKLCYLGLRCEDEMPFFTASSLAEEYFSENALVKKSVFSLKLGS
jgi:hypothetical protein